jgi:transcriptional regulator with XRE-family HTH domain
VDDQRIGNAFRALRIRRDWTQRELASRVGVSAGLISLVERGHIGSVATRLLRRLAGALECRLELRLISRGGDVDRLVNAGHAGLREEVMRFVAELPDWLQQPEVSFAVYSERGIIDILCFHPPTGSLLVIELKTELVSFEDLLTTMDIRMRHAKRIARDRGWVATSVSAWIVVAESQANRRRARRQAATLSASYPANGIEMRAWLRRPSGAIRALSFWSNSNPGSATQTHYTRRRVRKAQSRQVAA